ncbi:hypothetical protein chiPu_0027192, partial [Chiloscyllium punctatum]|nr:hypothetical protein [Chiloscyllium punctatum]
MLGVLAQYQGCLFVHQGWPLCLGEQLVLQLSALDWRALQPEDFYLQLAPTGSRGATLLLKCRAWGGGGGGGGGNDHDHDDHDDDDDSESEEGEEGGGIVELPIAEDAYPHLFTVEWLDGVNRRLRRDARSPPRRLRSCLLASAGGRLRRMRWSRLVCPRLREPPAPAGRPRASGDGAAAADDDGGPLRLREAAAADKGDGAGGGGRDPTPRRQRVQEDVEAGEYVELREVSAPPLAEGGPAGQPRLRSSTLPAAGRPGRRRRGAQAQHRAWVHQPPRRRRRKGACGEAAAHVAAGRAHVAAGRPHVASPRATEPTNGPPPWRGLVLPTRWAEGGPGDGAPLGGRSGPVAAWTRPPLAEREGPTTAEPPLAERKG